jgi:hypothetical protein
MELTEKEDVSKVTLDQQFAIIKNLTSKSHVMRYGDLRFVKEPVGNFMGNLNLIEAKSNFFDKMFNKAKELTGLEDSIKAGLELKLVSAVNSRDIKLNHLYAKVQRNKSPRA